MFINIRGSFSGQNNYCLNHFLWLRSQATVHVRIHIGMNTYTPHPFVADETSPDVGDVKNGSLENRSAMVQHRTTCWD